MIKNIVFDMGNVITEFTPKEYMKAFIDDADKRERLFRLVFKSREWIMLDLGVITFAQAADVWKSRDGELKNEIDELCARWHLHKTLIPETNNLACALKDKGLGIYLLSNVGEKFPLYKDKVPALRILDGCIVSFEHHVVKPDPAIYEILYKTYSLRPEECFFVDDVAENVRAGEKLGMSGFVFPKDVSSRTATERLIAALNKAGVEISFDEISRYHCAAAF